ncbi:helix-turn-helix transcriptional regulator [Ligilactobacillus sp. LYQ112]|uniref:helix-turn-helix transcriptional regulator n=1 Tax=Ligilactobacillus sp. LYQ112 TaxID=3391060 RepID=UPI0039836BBB
MFGNKLLNGKQLTEALGISSSYLYTLLKAGLPYHQLANSRKYYALDEVEEWIMQVGFVKKGG